MIDIKGIIEESIAVKQTILNKSELVEKIKSAAELIIDCYQNNDGKVLFCGNGGSAGDAQHIAAELSGRFYLDRRPLFAEALHVNSSYLTAVANDYSFDAVYERMTEAMGRSGDVLIGISTSGNSKNVINAMKKAKEIGMVTIGLTGETGGEMKNYSDIILNVPSNCTPRIQESHILIGHILCEVIEEELFKS